MNLRWSREGEISVFKKMLHFCATRYGQTFSPSVPREIKLLLLSYSYSYSYDSMILEITLTIKY